MAKKNNKKGSSSSKKKEDAVCLCSDPFKCACGKRPERPSKGHKWDTETKQWTGKGHKQKGGGFGHTDEKFVKAKTTESGKTKIMPWQRLPSALLREYCKKNDKKVQPPKFYDRSSEIKGKGGGAQSASGGKSFLYLCIVHDKKKKENDLFFKPKNACQNEEQAKEESALLALLHLTPTLPHERFLPEPYKTTWLHVIDNNKKNGTSSSTTTRTRATSNAATTDTVNDKNNNHKASSTASKANLNLEMGSNFTSRADRQKHNSTKRQQINKRIQYHEASRMANKDHSVFMSASIRKVIQKLLRGENTSSLSSSMTDLSEDEEEDQDEEEPTSETSLLKTYVLERLQHEGFTKKQALKAFRISCSSEKTGSGDDDMDQAYEDCLQWLCIHLEEDDLPEGFDPRGKTLDVIAPKSSSFSSLAATKGDSANDDTGDIIPGLDMYGLSRKEMIFVSKQMQQNGNHNTAGLNNSITLISTLWNAFWKSAQNDDDNSTFEETVAISEERKETNKMLLQDELEVLESVFSPEEYSVKTDTFSSSLTEITIKLPENDDNDTGVVVVKNSELKILIDNGEYPNKLPKVFLTGVWLSKRVGTKAHAKIIRFLKEHKEMNQDDPMPMIYELYGQVTAEIIYADSYNDCDIPSIGVDSKNDVNKDQAVVPTPVSSASPEMTKKNNQSLQKGEKGQKGETKQRMRPTLRKRRSNQRSFWNTDPSKMQPYDYDATSSSKKKTKTSSDIIKQRFSLPAAKAKKEFISILSSNNNGNNQVTLVTGETGSGKTTQIPQFILEEYPQSKIVVCQPRRLAAVGVSNRVADECSACSKGGGEVVGYTVRGDVKANADKTRVMFCTTGVLLRQLQNEDRDEKMMKCITHILVDEVHERHLDTDVLLGLLKKLLRRHKHLKVVLMSATMDADRFASYWGDNTPRMHISGFAHPVKDYTLEDVLDFTGYIPPKNPNKQKKKKKKSYQNDYDYEEDDNEKANKTKSDGAVSSYKISLEDALARMDERIIDYKLIATLVQHLVTNKSKQDDGSILVFLPGAPEISQAERALNRIKGIEVLPLHGGLQSKDQNRVFRPPSIRGNTKVILSTNVAETSITIPDCTMVIDTCKEKQSSYDPQNRMPLLLEKFSSLDSLKQRRGRAGRVRPGTCYKLISKDTMKKLKEHGEPEIKRCALDQTLLSALFLGVENGFGSFLRTLLDPPSKDAILSAIFALRTLGAVKIVDEKKVVLTPLGKHLAGIPAPPPVGKLMVIGSILGVRREAITIAAGMTVGRSPFLKIDMNERRKKSPEEEDNGDDNVTDEDIQNMKKQNILSEREKIFKVVGNSDHAMLAAVYRKWELSEKKKIFCETMGLSFNGMRDMKKLVVQYDSVLNSLGFSEMNNTEDKTKWRTVHACVVAALSPGNIVRVFRPISKYAETKEGALEKDAKAKEVKFFVRISSSSNASDNIIQKYHDIQEERVFIHPSSFNFQVGSYSCPWLVYHNLVRTSKPFVREATECSSYSFLLFGGNIEVKASQSLITIDDYVRLSASPRIGALIGGLRKKLEELLDMKVNDPNKDIFSTDEIKTVIALIVTDGLGKL